MSLVPVSEDHQVSSELSSSSLTQQRPPLVVDLQQVEPRVPLLPLKFVLTTDHNQAEQLLTAW